METSWINPLSQDQDGFVSLSTSSLATSDVANDLLKAHSIGEQAYKDFKEDRLQKYPPTAKFYDTMKKQSLKTFTHLNRKVSCKSQASNIVLKADRKLFGQMIIVAQSRQVNMSEVLAHALGPLPWALSNGDGSLRKTNKAALGKECGAGRNHLQTISIHHRWDEPCAENERDSKTFAEL